jgi:hypothetical protein
MRGAQGFWSLATLGLIAAAIGLTGFLAWKLRRDSRAAMPTRRLAT